MNLSTPLSKSGIRGIGEKKAGLYSKLGLLTIGDLLGYYPRDYEDRRAVKEIKSLELNENICVSAALVSPARLNRISGGRSMVKCKVSDGTGVMDITFFNQTWIKDRLKTGEEYIFYGKVAGNLLKKDMINPVFEPVSAPGRLTGKLVPVYPLTAGITSQAISDAVSQALKLCENQLEDIIPGEIRERFKLCHRLFALQSIHFPEDDQSLEIARRRLIFEEFFILALGFRMMKTQGDKAGIKIPPADLDNFREKLGFTLTGAQDRTIGEIARDLTSGKLMNRLVQGDVGSGKTIVAAAAAWLCALGGYQTAYMAPTEILAGQHFASLSPLFAQFGMGVSLLTGSMTAKQKRLERELIESGQSRIVIGTHALISDDVAFDRLGLVITDEQHRFGVRQRAALSEKGEDLAPHVLVMSATPIPRTLALMIYGDLDVSVIDELPPGRQKIDTFPVGEKMRPRINNFIRRLVGEGRQVYVVCSLVGDPEAEGELPGDDRKAVEAYARTLQNETFPELRVGHIHGKMKPKEKDEIMAAFSAGEIDILVSTTVIEVGIDVPNAALIVVENAERFGLSQLHQLRGRVGRGKHKSYCVLFSDSVGETARARLETMKSTNDGFKIAESDLRLRGPGDFFGDRQHGLPLLKIASLADDTEALHSATNAAAELQQSDPGLTDPMHVALREAVLSLFRDGAMS